MSLSKSNGMSNVMLKSHNNMMTEQLSIIDPEVFDIIKKEKHRQKYSLALIPSENFPSQAVVQAVGSCMSNKYSKCYPGQRCYPGTQNVDDMERLCQKRALEAFGLDSEKWGVNVQPLSGTPYNIAIYTAVVGIHGKYMGLDIPDGGHVFHGNKDSFSSNVFECMPFKVDPKTGKIDYDKLEEQARLYQPKLIIAGTTSYSRILDYARFRQIADEVGAFLYADMAHISGLVAAGVVNSPFEHCDIVATTTHKTLRGCRGGLIFYRKGVRVDAKGKKTQYNLESLINKAVFPGVQGGPHNHTISGVAVALKQAKTPEFKAYQQQVLANSKVMGDTLMTLGYKLVTGGSDNHLIMVDLQPNSIDAEWAETVLEACAIICCKSIFAAPKGVEHPLGLRFGSPALTSRGLVESDFKKVTEFIHRGLQLTLEFQSSLGPQATLEDLKKALAPGNKHQQGEAELRADVQAFIGSFPMPGLPEL